MSKKKKQEQTSNADTQEKTKKQSSICAVFGSIALCIITFLVTIMLIFSASLHLMLKQDGIPKAIERLDLASATLSYEGENRSIGSLIYEWYMQGAPNLTESYAESAVATDEFKNVLCQYFYDLGDYLLKENNVLPTLNAEDFADVLQNDLAGTLEQETGVIFTEEDRTYFLWATDEDFPEWNADMESLVGSGFGRFCIRFFISVPGLITLVALLVVLFILWLIFAVKGHWRKGRMLTGYGAAIAIPGLLLLCGGGIFLLLVTGMDVIDTLSFLKQSLPLLVLPVIWPSLALALYGLIFGSIGICWNKIAKAKREKAEAKEVDEILPSENTNTQNLESTAPPTPVPTEEPFQYTHIPAEASATEESPITETTQPEQPELTTCTCPHCGKENEPGSVFCGGCGKKI
ncbi:MAG: zinc ribbon domain-containing protein [Ruminococcus sp.]|nr:zinc ribbon domain-containing protein [Ruminococcus sp.]